MSHTILIESHDHAKTYECHGSYCDECFLCLMKQKYGCKWDTARRCGVFTIHE